MKTRSNRFHLPPWATSLLRWGRRVVYGGIFLVLMAVLLELLAVYFFPGRSTRFLVSGETSGQKAWIDNQFFPYRFFPARAAPTPIPVTALKEAPEQTIRICLLGDRAAMGNPTPPFGLGRQLEMMLQTRYPQHRVEIVHMTMEGGNSHVLREVARDLKQLKPNAVILLTGNDEITGPYGPASTLGKYNHSSRVARMMAVFSRSRLSQLFITALNRVTPARTDLTIWKSHEPIMMKGRLSAGDPRLKTAYRSFRKNITAILEQAVEASPVVIVCTVPVNLKDCAPFITTYLSDETAAQEAREKLRAAIAAEATHREEAVRLYEEVIRINPLHAEALFRAARLALDEDRLAEAADLFSRARDADALRLRADSHQNALLRECAEALDVSLLDAELLFAMRSPQGIPGHEWFLDHIHFTFEGHYLLASALVDRMEFLQAFGHAIPASPLPNPEFLANDLLFTPWGHVTQLEAVLNELAHYPFQRQLTQGEAVARLNQEKEIWDKRLEDMTPESTRAIFARQQAARPRDAWLAMRAARYLLNAGDFVRAESAAEAALQQWPHRFDVRTMLAWTRAMQVDVPGAAQEILAQQLQAEAEKTAAEEAERTRLSAEASETAQAHRAANAEARTARTALNNAWKAAEAEWRETQLDTVPEDEWPDPPEFVLPEELVAANEKAAALAAETKALSEAASLALLKFQDAQAARLRAIMDDLARQDMEEGQDLIINGDEDCGYYDISTALFLGQALKHRDRAVQAIPWLHSALRRDIWNSESSIALAEAYAQAGDNEKSIETLQAAIERNPRNPLLWENLASLHCLFGNWTMATICFRKAEELAPYRYERLLKWADALARLKQFDRAQRRIDQYLVSVPYDPEALALKAHIQSNLPAQRSSSSPVPVEKAEPRRFPWE
ncbi:MAG: tetratricopeptide repeat protein [Verrucomicrobiota bacterium]|nr:tetratricopeptide repeat protein [Verrucomicrobiota bacterium]